MGFWVALDPCCSLQAFSSCKPGPLFVAALGLPIVAISLAEEHRLWGTQAQSLQHMGSRVHAQWLWPMNLVTP